MTATPEQCRKYRQRLKKRAWSALGTICRFCGKDAVHMAHVRENGINGQGRGLNRRMLSVLKNPTDYAAMCATCHKTWDDLLAVREGEMF